MNVTIIQHYDVIQQLKQTLLHVLSYTHQLSTTALKEDVDVSILVVVVPVPHRLSPRVTSSTTNKTHLVMQQSSHMETYVSTNHASLVTTKVIKYFTRMVVVHIKSKSSIAHLITTS